MEEVEPSAIAKWAVRAMLVLLVALGANKLFDLRWLAPWDVHGDVGFYCVLGLSFAWTAWQRRQRNTRPPDPERARLEAQWSAPEGRRSKRQVALYAAVMMAIVVVVTLYTNGPSDRAWPEAAVIVVMAAVLGVVLYRGQFQQADVVVENGTGLSVSRGSQEVQVAWSQVAGIEYEIKHNIVKVRIDLKDPVPPFGKAIRFMPRKSMDLSDAEQAMLLEQMRKRAGLGTAASNP